MQTFRRKGHHQCNTEEFSSNRKELLSFGWAAKVQSSKFKIRIHQISGARGGCGLLGSLAACTSRCTLEWVCQATSGGAVNASPSIRFQPWRSRAGMFISLVTGLWGTENTSGLDFRLRQRARPREHCLKVVRVASC